jgi:hypothetical protein
MLGHDCLPLIRVLPGDVPQTSENRGESR